MAVQAIYRITTWDSENRRWSPQVGLREPWDNLTLFELRTAMRGLQQMGYECRNGDPSVMVERIGFAEVDGSRHKRQTELF